MTTVPIQPEDRHVSILLKHQPAEGFFLTKPEELNRWADAKRDELGLRHQIDEFAETSGGCVTD